MLNWMLLWHKEDLEELYNLIVDTYSTPSVS
jgi:hypothetical protein